MPHVTARLANRRTNRRATNRTGRYRFERLEGRQLLSASPIDRSFAAREGEAPFSVHVADVAVLDDGKVLVAETRTVGSVARMAVSRFNVNGSLDATFGAGGRAFADFGDAADSVTSMDLAPNGRIVIAGGAAPFGATDYAVACFNPDGTLERSFGGDGTVRLDLGGQGEQLRDVRFDAAGRVVASGSDGSGKVNVFRFTASGTPDPSFGEKNGWVQTPFEGRSAVLTLPDNRVVVAGQNGARLAVRRLLDNGSTEIDFGSGVFSGQPSDLALQPDGKVIATTFGSGAFSLRRYTSAGQLDPAFGTGGVVTSDLGDGGADASGVAVQADGRIVATGIAWQYGLGGYDFYTVRYLPDGAPDPSFGGDGVVNTDFRLGSTDLARGVALAPGGKVVVAGDVHVFYADLDTAGIARYNPDGSPDTTFGENGTVVDTVDGGHRRTISAVRRQPDGKVVVAGRQQVGLNFDFFVARYLADGRRDPSFGDGGVTVTDFGGRYDAANALLIQPDGRIVVGGQSSGETVNNVPDQRFALARYTTDGRLDPSFGVAGRVITDLGATYGEGVHDLDLYPGGRIVATGYGGVARYNDGGSLDTSFATDGTLDLPGLWAIAGAVSGDKILYADGGFVRRVNADGSPDPTFSFQRIPAPASEVNDPDEGEPYTAFAGMEPAPDGKIVIAGTYHPRDYSDDITAFAVQRYLPTGAPDPSFGTGGQTVSDFVELYEEQVTALALAPDGRPVLVGRGDAVPLAARYTTDGRPDGSFGYNGKAFVEDGTFEASSVTVEPDGDVLVATNGFTPTGFLGKAAVTRLSGNIRPGASLDRLLSTVFVTGTAGNDAIRLDTTGGRLTVWVNGRRQTFSERQFDDVRVYAGDGDDTVTITGRRAVSVFGGNGNDRLLGGEGAQQLYGEADNDTLDGGLGNDRLSGGDGLDTVDYSARSAPLVVRRGAGESGQAGEFDRVGFDTEIVRGGWGDDRIEGFQAAYGNAGNDTLIGGYGSDALWGGDGDDLLDGGPAIGRPEGDYFRGGAGSDTVTYADRYEPVVVTIDGVANDGAPASPGYSGEGDNVYTDVENVIGGHGDDKLTGSAADNDLDGGAGNDDLRGGDGDDTLTGGPGKDQLRGQGGNDTLYADGDNTPDFLDGGPGDRDRARKDDNDFAQYVEQLLA